MGSNVPILTLRPLRRIAGDGYDSTSGQSTTTARWSQIGRLQPVGRSMSATLLQAADL